MLRRLDDLAAGLATRPGTIAVLGLGSAGVQTERLDEHSDLDFFVIVDDDAVAGYLESIDWLEESAPVVYSFANEHNGRKALFADGIFVEYAVFTLDQLATLPFAGARVVWQRDGALPGLVHSGARPPNPTPFDTIEFHLNEALTNLYVGMHREVRGERLTATRFIQSYAVDRVIALLRLRPDLTRQASVGIDPWDCTRRVELAYPPVVLPLSAMVPGYAHNSSAARTILGWLTERFDVDPVIRQAIERLLGQSGQAGHQSIDVMPTS